MLDSVRAALDGFRAAPLTPAQANPPRRAIDPLFEFVPVEYERGVVDGKVTKALEIQEAVTFHEAAQAAFDDLHDLLNQYDPGKTDKPAPTY